MKFNLGAAGAAAWVVQPCLRAGHACNLGVAAVRRGRKRPDLFIFIARGGVRYTVLAAHVTEKNTVFYTVGHAKESLPPFGHAFL